MPRMILAFGFSLMLFLAGVALWFDRKPDNVESRDHHSEKGQITAGTLYATRLTDLTGHERSLGQWQGRLLLINFWATWCAPCKDEMPILAKLQREHAGDGLQIIGIAVDSRENVVKFSQQTPMNYPIFPDEGRAIELSKRLGNRLGVLPFTVAIAPGGELIFSRVGQLKEAEVRRLIVNNRPK